MRNSFGSESATPKKVVPAEFTSANSSIQKDPTRIPSTARDDFLSNSLETKLSLKRLPAISNSNNTSGSALPGSNRASVTERKIPDQNPFHYDGIFRIPVLPKPRYVSMNGPTPEKTVIVPNPYTSADRAGIKWHEYAQKTMLPDEVERPSFAAADASAFTKLAEPYVSLIKREGHLSMSLVDMSNSIPKVNVSMISNSPHFQRIYPF